MLYPSVTSSISTLRSRAFHAAKAGCAEMLSSRGDRSTSRKSFPVIAIDGTAC
jgi:hypothetical protein